MIRVIKASERDEQIYKFLVDYMHEDADKAQEVVDTNDYVLVDGETPKDLGYNFVYEVLGDIQEVFNKQKFFSFEKYGKLFIESGEFSLSDNGTYVDSEGIDSGTDNEGDLGIFIFEEFFSGDFNNISEADLVKCFDYEKFGKALLEESNFYKLDDKHYIQF